MREYKLHKLRLMILARLLYGEKIELVIDGTIVDIANVNRARTQKIRRVRGKVWWAKRRRKLSVRFPPFKAHTYGSKPLFYAFIILYHL